MKMNRRGFLQSMLALGAAPAIVKAESLMKLWVPPQDLYLAEAGLPNSMQSAQFMNMFMENNPFTGSWTASTLVRKAGSHRWVQQSISCVSSGQPTLVATSDGNIAFEGKENVGRHSAPVGEPTPSPWDVQVSGNGRMKLGPDGFYSEPGVMVCYTPPKPWYDETNLRFPDAMLAKPLEYKGERRVINTLVTGVWK